MEDEDGREGAQDLSAQEDALGPPLKGVLDPMPLDVGQCGAAAWRGYNEAIQEFRTTRTVTQKATADFAHLINPKGAGEAAYKGHCLALEDIENWRAKWEPPAFADDVESARPAEAEPDATAERGLSLANGEPVSDGPAPFEESDMQADRRENDPYTDGMIQPVNEPAAARNSALSAVTLRGEIFNPKARPVTYDGFGRARELDVTRSAAFLRPPAGCTDEDTQGWLNAILGECHFLMREVMFRSICATDKLEDRLGIVRHTMDVAKAAAKVGKSIAELKREQVVEARRKTTLERVESVSMKGGAS